MQIQISNGAPALCKSNFVTEVLCHFMPAPLRQQDSDCDVGGEGCIPSGTWTERYGNVHCQSKSTAVNPGERGYGPRLLAPSPDHTAGRRWTHTENRINPHRIEGTAGSACYCYCGVAQAIGKCYDMPQNATAAQCNVRNRLCL